MTSKQMVQVQVRHVAVDELVADPITPSDLAVCIARSPASSLSLLLLSRNSNIFWRMIWDGADVRNMRAGFLIVFFNPCLLPSRVDDLLVGLLLGASATSCCCRHCCAVFCLG
jgi:hypothetical protein